MTTPLNPLKTPRFDWMQATIRDDVDHISETFAELLGGQVEKGRGLNGYRESRVIKRDDETLAKVLFGGNGNPHLIASGAATDEAVPILRDHWTLSHEVTRMDSAQDFDSEGAFSLIRGVMVDLAVSSNISITEIESTKGGVRSRTVYLGSPSSRMRVRLYEKGHFEHQLGNTDASLGWVRLEAQVRPSGEARRTAGGLDALGAWGLSRWTRELALVALGAVVEPVTMQARREPDYMRAFRSMQRQYGATLARALIVEGSWEAVGRRLGVLEHEVTAEQAQAS